MYHDIEKEGQVVTIKKLKNTDFSRHTLFQSEATLKYPEIYGDNYFKYA